MHGLDRFDLSIPLRDSFIISLITNIAQQHPFFFVSPGIVFTPLAFVGVLRLTVFSLFLLDGVVTLPAKSYKYNFSAKFWYSWLIPVPSLADVYMNVALRLCAYAFAVFSGTSARSTQSVLVATIAITIF